MAVVVERDHVVASVWVHPRGDRRPSTHRESFNDAAIDENVQVD